MLYFTDFAKFSYIYNSVLKSQVSFTKNTQNLLTKINSLLAGFSFVQFGRSKQTGITAGQFCQT